MPACEIMMIMMTERRKKRILRKIRDEKEELSKLSSCLFEPVGKNPYYLRRDGDGTAIKNLSELRDNLDAFTNEEALWLASWLDYLGDTESAERIRQTPERFKMIVEERYKELEEFAKRQ